MIQNSYNFDMQQGATFQLQINVVDSRNQPIDLTEYSSVMQIRSSYSNTVIAEQLSTANGEIQIPLGTNSSNNVMNLTLPASRTANIYVNMLGTTVPPKTIYVYDITLTAANTVATKILYGSINLYGQVTR
jgi:hypothetical protein